MLHIGGLEETNLRVQEVNLFFQTMNTSGLTSVNDVTLPEKWYGSTKKFEARLFIGAYNYFPLEDLRLM